MKKAAAILALGGLFLAVAVDTESIILQRIGARTDITGTGPPG